MFPYINRLHDILKDQNPFPLIRMPLPVDGGDGHRSGNVGRGWPKIACVSPMDIPATKWQAGA